MSSTRSGAQPRQRAKPTEGERTTLRIPRQLTPDVERVVRERGVTRNEALLELAEVGARVLAAERRAAAARERLARAVLAPVAAGDLPSPDDVAAAMREARGGRT